MSKSNQAALHDRTVRRKPFNHEYNGLDGRIASRFGIALCEAAARTGCWINLPEHLLALRPCLFTEP